MQRDLNKGSINARRVLTALLLLACLARIGYALTRPSTRPTWRDSLHYLAIAENLRSQGAYADSLGPHTTCGIEPLYSDPGLTAFWLPGYPALLAAVQALFGEDVRFAYLANAILSCLALMIVARIALRLFGASRALVPVSLLALSPTQLYYVGVVGTEALSTFLLSSVFWLTMLYCTSSTPARRALVGVLLGMCAGWGLLTRANFLFASLGLFAFVVWHQKRHVQRAAAWVLVPAVAACLVVLPWLLRNYLTFHSLVYASNSGLNLLAGFSDLATGGFTLRAVPCLPYPEFSELERSSQYSHMAVDWIFAHPGRAIILTLRKALLLFNPIPDTVSGPKAWLLGMTSGALIFGALLGANKARRATEGQIAVVIVAGYLLPVLATFAITRFRVPLEPILALLSCFAFRAMPRSKETPVASPSDGRDQPNPGHPLPARALCLAGE